MAYHGAMAKETGQLIICPTPLGNLGDMTPRALEALASADAVCCEDTRVTGRLLTALGVEGVRLERLDEAVLGARAAVIVQRVLDGETIAYCSDAGMPGVSDPGARLVAAAREAGAPVVVLPGPVAFATAYVASGFVCPRVYFGGFFPRKAGERESCVAALRALDAVAVFYESPRRLASALEVVARMLPERRVCICRELTKLHEEVWVGSAQDAAAEFAAREAAGGIKGEIALVVDAPAASELDGAAEAARSAAAVRASELLADSSLTNKDRVAILRREFGIARNDAYALVHGA